MKQKAEVKRYFGSNKKVREFKESEFSGELTFERW